MHSRCDDDRSPSQSHFRYFYCLFFFLIASVYNFNCLNVFDGVCVGVRACVCTSVMFTHTQSEFNTRRIQHAENHKARSNCKLEIRRRRRWRRNADADCDCDCDGKLEATDTCSLRTCRGEAQSQRQLASEWTVLASLVAAVQPQQQQQQHSSVSRWKKCEKYVKLCL